MRCRLFRLWAEPAEGRQSFSHDVTRGVDFREVTCPPQRVPAGFAMGTGVPLPLWSQEAARNDIGECRIVSS